MRKSAIFEALIILASILIPVERVQAQVSYDTVTATVTDPDGHLLANAPFSWVLVDSLGNRVSSATTPNGQIYNAAPVRGNLSNAGVMSVQLVPNGILTKPSNTQWQLAITPPLPVDQSNILTYQPPWNLTYNTTISAPVDLSAQISAQTNVVNFFNTQTGQSTLTGWLVGSSDPPNKTCSASVHAGYLYMAADGNSFQCNNAVGGTYQWNPVSSTNTVTGMATISNIAALKTYSGTATAINVIGYYSASVTSAPDGGGGIFIDTGAPSIPILTLTSVANSSSFSTVYTGSTPGCAADACVNYAVNITGFTNTANNGGYFIVASTATTITVNNLFGVAETHAGTATPLNTDDGGVHLLDTAANHVWQRQNVTLGDTYSAWFGVRSNDGNLYDNCTQAQNAINYTSLVGGPASYGTYIHGQLHWQSGLIQYWCTLVEPETPQWSGTGTQAPGRGGTELQYMGSGSTSILFNGAGFSSIAKKISDMTFSTDLSHPGTWTRLLEIDGTPHPAGGSFQIDQSQFSNVNFQNATGAAVYFHVLPPVGAPIATFTATISDGTGSAPGNIMCVSSGSPAGPYWLTGAGIPDYVYLNQSLDPSISLFPATCTGSASGTPYLITGSPLHISAETITQGFALGPYSQENLWTNIKTSGVGQLIETDPYNSGPQDNVFTLIGYAGENGQQISAGIAPVWADLSGFANFYIFSPVYEGGAAASPFIYRVAQNGTVYNQYIENGTGGAPIHSIFEFPAGVNNAKVKLIDGYVGGAVSLDHGYATFDAYTSGNNVEVNNAPLTTAAQTAYLQVGNATQNSVSQTNNVIPGPLRPSMMTWDVYRDMVARCSQPILSGENCHITIPQSVPFVDLHGGWLDGLNQGPVSITTSSLANKGIVVDSDEGRIFEMVGTAGTQPVLNVTFNNIPADLRGQQVTETIRWKFHTTTAGYVMCPFNVDGFSSRGISTTCLSTQYLPDTWYTSYAVQVLPSVGSPVFGSQIATGSPSLGGGTVTYDVSAIHIEAGVNIPVTMVGANPAQPLDLGYCAAAPTYGTYNIGDHCQNSAPASGQPMGWVVTTAPSTWKPLANIP